ncbi:unnamed protein product [Cuscuta campestris]|uniref:Retrotransposon gag domain-containing protein n=1 Tax=Cuscuta campestris TaxID=132261 RepID=A0A484LUF0_9ASTE|nr:unnamed protein product [Cuscuta campestris]
MYFATNGRKKLHFSHLLSVRQRPDEPLSDFLTRWKLETTKVYGVDDKAKLSTFHLVLRWGDFSKRLALEKPKEYSVGMTMAMAEDEAEAEELEANKKREEEGGLGAQVVLARPRPKKNTEEQSPTSSGHRYKKGRDQQNQQPQGRDIYEEMGYGERKPYPSYPPHSPKLMLLKEHTPLTHPISMILDYVEHQGRVEYDPRFDLVYVVENGPYCRFHWAGSHDSDECKVLKKRNTWQKDDGKKPADHSGKKAVEAPQKRRK